MTLYKAQGTHKRYLWTVTEVLKFEACVIFVRIQIRKRTHSSARSNPVFNDRENS